MNVYRMNKPELIIELEKRSLPTNGLKEELKSRLIEAIEMENEDQKNSKSDSLNDQEDYDESPNHKIEHSNDDGTIEKSLNQASAESAEEDQFIINDGDRSAENANVKKAISSDEIIDNGSSSSSLSLIVNVNDDDEDDVADGRVKTDHQKLSNVPNNGPNNGNDKISQREIDNGDHEIIEISEEVVIDEDENDDNGFASTESKNRLELSTKHDGDDHKYDGDRGNRDSGDEMEHEREREEKEREQEPEHVGGEEDEEEAEEVVDDQEEEEEEGVGEVVGGEEEDDEVTIMEKIESRKEELAKISGKTEIWVNNIAEDVKAVELKELFGKYGKVISAKVVMNAKNPSGNCFGCIQLATVNDAKMCIKNLDQTEFRGNVITVTNDVNEKSSKEKIVRNISPVSSSASWGSKKSSGNKKGFTNSLTVSSSQSQPTRNRNDQSFDRDKRPSYRTNRPNHNDGGQFYRGTRSFNDRGPINKREPKPSSQYNQRNTGYGERSENTKLHYRTGGGAGGNGGGVGAGRGNYRNNNSYGYESNINNSSSRGKDIYARREQSSRDNYKPQYESSSSSRYSSSVVNRDRQTARIISDDYPDKMKPCYDYRNNKPSKYNPYDEYDSRRDLKRSTFDRPMSSSATRDFDTYYPGSNNKRIDVYKRPRPEEDDEYFQAKRKRSDFFPSDRSHYRNIDSPKKSYYSEELKKSEYKTRRDDYNAPIYTNSKNNEHFCTTLRRPMDYSYRRETYEDYHHPLDKHSNRSNHYNKDSYAQQHSQHQQQQQQHHHSTDFGGRSRRY